MSSSKLNRAFTAQLYFDDALNGFLSAERRSAPFRYYFNGHPAVKDAIEACGVPHTEVSAIDVNGSAVPFSYQLRRGDSITVFGEPADAGGGGLMVALRESPPYPARFVLDVHLGKLARLLRLLGLDALYRNDFRDAEIVASGVREQRIILTRDRRLLFHRAVVHGYFIRSDDPETQVLEVIDRFAIREMLKPFHRCLHCNGKIRSVPKAAVRNRLLPKTSQYYDEFFQCGGCGKVYWKGPHYDHLSQRLSVLKRRLGSKALVSIK